MNISGFCRKQTRLDFLNANGKKFIISFEFVSTKLPAMKGAKCQNYFNSRVHRQFFYYLFDDLW